FWLPGGQGGRSLRCISHRYTQAGPPPYGIACRVERVASIETCFQRGGTEMQSTMKALMKDGNAVAVKTVPQPRVQREDEVLIRVVLAGLCRTDVYVAEGRIVAPDPLLLGHEFAGVVAEVGAQITGLKPGDRVAVNPALPCEKCQLCVQGATADCQQT